MEPKMDAGLRALAYSGSFQDLESLLNGKAAAYTIGSSATQPPALYAVTVGGDTLLHVVAAINGDSEDSTNKASLVYDKAPSILFVQNCHGDTPLHSAARAGNMRMVSLLIDLANGQGINNAKGLLETQNKIHETALHEAVRSGNNDMVKLFMEENPQLARFPEQGTSPLYLAVLLENKIIAKTLYDLSGGLLSYSGPDGRNALHVAVQGSQVDRMDIGTVDYACRNISLSWILNMQDKDGNTGLHLAENEVQILKALKYVSAKRGIVHQGFLDEFDIDQSRQEEIHMMSQVKEGTQSLCIGSVLIATVTFGATFTMPGGLRADDHTNAGSPTLAGTFYFYAFIVANTIAFTLSVMATISYIISGTPAIERVFLSADISNGLSVNHIQQFYTLWALWDLVYLQDDVPDDITWTLTSNGVYSAASAYKVQFKGTILITMLSGFGV
ncbi:protein ACCELERATED CELL DEATH 6-like [Triticum aestivum]|uniref:protein ACCELERATED CELL DEATH 6-like n=1 Tax=Triticum aestivum TaxID=4565 RepID=UPI001D01C282|nr:protein ACCELERATED CELL DEATH 6-like [Triticum aestivum]